MILLQLTAIDGDITFINFDHVMSFWLERNGDGSRCTRIRLRNTHEHRVKELPEQIAKALQQ